jgi:hypothetical protein
LVNLTGPVESQHIESGRIVLRVRGISPTLEQGGAGRLGRATEPGGGSHEDMSCTEE